MWNWEDGGTIYHEEARSVCMCVHREKREKRKKERGEKRGGEDWNGKDNNKYFLFCVFSKYSFE